MSAFIVNKKHIDALVTYGVRHNVQVYLSDGTYLDFRNEYDRAGQILTDANYLSINTRYADNAQVPKYHWQSYSYDLSAVQIIKACHCYDYQTCEFEGYWQSDARSIINSLEHRAGTDLPGYDDAMWEIIEPVQKEVETVKVETVVVPKQTLYPELKLVQSESEQPEDEDCVRVPNSNGYSSNAWEGSNYDSKLTLTEIAKRIRQELKNTGCKFSVTKETYSMGASLHISLMEAPFDAFTDKIDPDVKEDQYAQVNQYYFENHESYTDEAKAVLRKAIDLADSYNYDDSDSMSDYFSNNFYLHVNIGKWNKPFKKVVK